MSLGHLEGYPSFRKDSQSFLCMGSWSVMFLCIQMTWAGCLCIVPEQCPSINVNILPSSTLTGNWQSVISWMLINNEYPCHCLNTWNVFKWQNYKSGVCFVRTSIAFSFSPCTKERNKIPYSDTAHHLCYQPVLYFLKTIHLYLSWNFESYLLGYMIFYNNNTQYTMTVALNMTENL